MEIRHRIGVGEHHVALEHVDEPARHIPDALFFVFFDEELVRTGRVVLEFVGGDGLGGRQRFQHIEDALDELARALAGDRLDGIHGQGTAFAEAGDVLFGAEDVALVEGHDLRAGGQHFAVGGKLCVDLFKIFQRVAPLHAGDIHHMHQHARALDVAQEIVPQPRARRRALDEPGDIRRHEGTVVKLHHAQIGGKGGEVVVGDLGFGGADLG